MYSVKELFYTLQGEGAHTGRAAVFCRFSGCNLWSGREQDRHKAQCDFCDTDFIGTDGENGGKYRTAQALAEKARSLWPAQARRATPYIVCTGGEPLLQLDEPLIQAFKAVGFEVAIETNGTLPAPAGLDWICVSPKGNAPLELMQGDELKLVYPQLLTHPEQYQVLAFNHFFLQPLDGPHAEQNLQACIRYCHRHPQWRLSLQTHKLIGIP